VTNLITEIDNYLLSREGHERTAHYASDVSDCLRKLYYKWTEAPVSNPIEAGGYWKMNIGNSLQDMIQEFLREAGYEIAEEVADRQDIGLTYPMSYRLDDLFIEDGELSGIEIKTTYGRGVKDIQQAGTPKPEHLAQVVVYLKMEPSIQRFYMIYLGRDNGYRTQFIIDRSVIDDLWPNLLRRLQFLEECLGKGQIPEREYMAAIKYGEVRTKFQKNKVEYKTDWQCNYCQWCDHCWAPELSAYAQGDNSADFD